MLDTFSTYFIQKKTEEKKTILENTRKKEYASVILQISTKELNNYKTILAGIKEFGSEGRTSASNVFDKDEYLIESDAKLNDIQNEIKKATNLYSKLPLETRTSIFLSYLNSVDSAYEHFTKLTIGPKYNYKGVYSNNELIITIDKIDTALQEIKELTRILTGK